MLKILTPSVYFLFNNVDETAIFIDISNRSVMLCIFVVLIAKGLKTKELIKMPGYLL